MLAKQRKAPRRRGCRGGFETLGANWSVQPLAISPAISSAGQRCPASAGTATKAPITTARHRPMRRHGDAPRPDGRLHRCLHSHPRSQATFRAWVHEVKHYGYRLIVRREGETVRVFTRRGYDWTERYPAIAAARGQAACEVVHAGRRGGGHRRRWNRRVRCTPPAAPQPLCYAAQPEGNQSWGVEEFKKSPALQKRLLAQRRV
jgi:hypothetical protein